MAAQPQAYWRKTVAFEAHFETDNHHWALFTHPNCPLSVMFFENETNARIALSANGRGDEATIAAAFQAAPTTVGFHKQAARTGWRGKVTGTLQPAGAHHWSQPKPFGLLKIIQIDDLHGEDVKD